jgi:CPA2 family monovalent cation:H+ antiporter-2
MVVPCMMTGATGIVIAAGDVPPLFALLAVMFLGVVLVSLLLLKLQQSLLAGYFLCGVVIANSGVLDLFGAGSTHEEVAQMSEFGVMLLMFTLGLEFSLSELKYLRRLSFGGGSLQMGICGMIAGVAAFWLADVSWQAAVVIAVAMAMSSTAVSLKSFQDMGLESSPGGRMALAVAIFQDLFIIVFFLVLPLLLTGSGGAEGSLSGRVGSLLLRGVVFVMLAVVNARWVIPWLLRAVTRTRNRELFTHTVVGSCIGLAFVGAMLDLGLALGAFVAGLAVSESIYKHRILADIIPVKDLFLTLFFVSVGLMVDLSVAAQYWQPILLITVVLIFVKGGLITSIGRWLGLGHQQALMGGLGLSSAGEFSLLLLQKSGQVDLLDEGMEQTLLAAVALSMGLLPAVMRLGSPLAGTLEKWGWGRKHAVMPQSASARERVRGLSGHAIICGHGPVGEAVNRALLDAGVPTLVIELNADTVHNLQRTGQSVLFADASHHETWDLTRLATARMVAFTFPDATLTAEALAIIRQTREDIPVLARARFASDVERLKRLGATAVVHDEMEAGRSAVDQALVLQGEVGVSE